MLNRILEITEENRYISLSRGFVVIKQDSQILGQIPIDDISVLLLTAQGVTLSKNILNTLAENNCITVLCGKNYVPQSMVLPIANHCFYTKNIKMQITCTAPFKKKVWQQIVIQKIKNQALVLKLCKKHITLCKNMLLKTLKDKRINKKGAKKMKKLISLALAMIFVLSFMACSDEKAEENSSKTENEASYSSDESEYCFCLRY